MAKYRKKPVVIDAVEFTYPPTEELLKFCGDSISKIRKARHMHALGEADIITLEDGKAGQCKHIATEGDFIIRGVAGEFYPCKPGIFEKTYEPAYEVED